MLNPVIESLKSSFGLIFKLLIAVMVVWFLYAFLGFATGDIANGIYGRNPWLFISGQFIASAVGMVVLSCFYFQTPGTTPLGRIKSSWQVIFIALAGTVIIKFLTDEVFPSQQFQAFSISSLFWGFLFRILVIVNILYAYELVKLKLDTHALQFADAAKNVLTVITNNILAAAILALALYLIQIALNLLTQNFGSDAPSRLFFSVCIFGAVFWIWQAIVLLQYRTLMLDEKEQTIETSETE